MKKIIKLTENDLINLVKKIIKEQIVTPKPYVVIGGVTYKNKKLTIESIKISIYLLTISPLFVS